MQGGIDSEEIDRGGLKFSPRRERAAQDRRAGDDIGKAPADAHDFGGVGDAVEVAAAGRFHIGVLRRDVKVAVTRTKLPAQHDGATAPEGGIDEIFREALGLGLGADENRDPENDPAEAENEGALAVKKKAQRDVERRRHSDFSCRTPLYHPLPDELSGPQFVLIRNDHADRLPADLRAPRKIRACDTRP